MLWIRRRWVLRTIAALGLTIGMNEGSFANAQGGGGAPGGGGGGTAPGGGGAGGGGLGGGGGGLGGGGGGLGGQPGGQTGGQTRMGGAGGIGTGTTGGGTSQTNFLSGFYSNPIYMGRYTASNTASASSGSGGSGGAGGTGGTTVGGTSNTLLANIGGFGQPSLGTSTGTTGTQGGNRLGGTAGVSTNAGRTGQTGTGQTQGQSATRVLYSATLRFTPAPKPSSEMESELREILSRSSSLSNPTGIEVSVTDKVVTIRGRVANNDEKSLAEGLLRLAPGVREVRNELETQ